MRPVRLPGSNGGAFQNEKPKKIKVLLRGELWHLSKLFNLPHALRTGTQHKSCQSLRFNCCGLRICRAVAVEVAITAFCPSFCFALRVQTQESTTIKNMNQKNRFTKMERTRAASAPECVG